MVAVGIVALAAALLPPAGPAAAAPGDITTVAGASGAVPCGATTTQLRGPRAVAVDSAGIVYLADTDQYRILKVDASGTIVPVAGNGIQADLGDGGPAVHASFRFIFGLAVDLQGNLFVADAGAHRIRRVDAVTGLISTVAGSGTSGFTGDGGVATAARMTQPSGVAVDGAGNLFIADTGNHRIRKVTAATGLISTVVGVGAGFSGDGGPATAARLSVPRAVVVDDAGVLYIADTINYRVRRVATDGTIATVAGTGSRIASGDGGPAVSAGLGEIYGVALTPAADLLLASRDDHRIRKVVPGGPISTVAGGDGVQDTGPARTVALSFPSGVASSSTGAFFIADTGNDRIVRVATDGDLTFFAGLGVGDGCPATRAPLNRPTDVALAADGTLLIADRDNNRIRRVTADGIMSTLAGTGAAGRAGNGESATKADLDHPTGVVAGPDGSVYIADRENDWVRRVSPGGVLTTFAGALNLGQGLSGDGGPATAAQLRSPSALALDAAGDLYIADEENHRVRKVTASTGVISTVAGIGGQFGSFDGGFGGDGGPATAARLSSPTDVAVDAAGNVFIADSGNSRIRRVDPQGTISTVAGGTFGFSGDGGPATAAQLSFPTGVAIEGGGALVVADTGNQRVRRIDTAGIITTIAGTGEFGATGDGGPAVAAKFADPLGLTVAPDGSVYVVDGRNNRVRRIEQPPAVPVPPTVPPEPPPPRSAGGYWLVGGDGGVFAFGDAPYLGSTGALRLAAPVVGMAATPSGRGYWLVAADGGIFAFGDAPYLGSTGALRLTAPVVGMAATPSGRGYWLVAADGGIFAFGDAPYLGSTGALRLTRPVVGMARSPSGQGYWLVAADGGVFTYGDARYRGSLGRLTLNAPVVALASTPSGTGYWLVAADGGIFAFGARFWGSLGQSPRNGPVLDMAATGTGGGYLLMAADGGVFAFGDAAFSGSAGDLRLNEPIVAAARIGAT